MINNALLGDKLKNGAIVTMAHEIGHVIDLAHEIGAFANGAKGNEVSRKLRAASEYDASSIMRTPLSLIKGSISTSDCLAMDYYAKGSPKPIPCIKHEKRDWFVGMQYSEELL